MTPGGIRGGMKGVARHFWIGGVAALCFLRTAVRTEPVGEVQLAGDLLSPAGAAARRRSANHCPSACTPTPPGGPGFASRRALARRLRSRRPCETAARDHWLDKAHGKRTRPRSLSRVLAWLA